MKARYRAVRDYTHFCPSMVSATIEDYITMRRIIVGRDNIAGRIQWPKVAGLMASAIVKNRPVQLVPEDTDSKAYRLSRDNEVFAVIHGLAICAEGSGEAKIEGVVKAPLFGKWFQGLVYLLHDHPSQWEGFVQCFEALCIQHFPDVLDHGGD
jgi:hypothetical protein